jgi:HlyD family secretion protein
MKTFFKILIVIIIIVIFGGTIVFLYNKSKSEPVVYETSSPFISDVVMTTVATGSVVPRKEIVITPKVSGIIDKIYVEPGETIVKGDIIAKIKIIPDMLALNNAESRLNRAKINLENSKKDFDRQKDLLAKGVTAEAEFEDYELQYKSAEEELAAAINNLELIKEGQTKKAGKITNTLVRSTIEGMVLEVPVEEGNSVIESNTFNAGTTIATVADMGEMIFEGKIDETEVGKIKEGMPLILTIGAIEDFKFNALLEHISPKGVEENGAIQFEIKANVELNDSIFVRAGYSANADIVLDRRDSVMVIPESLLQFEEGKAFVEVESDKPQVFDKVFIEPGLSDGINIEVVSGLNIKDKIKRRSGSLR